MDIFFYNLELEKVFILPSSSKSVGYISMNVTTEFRGDGSFELVFYSEELERIIENNKAGLIISWCGFYGFSTSYQFKETEKRLFGVHLNGMLHKGIVLPHDALENDVETVAYNAIDSTLDWVTTTIKTNDFDDISIKQDNPTHLNSYMIDITKRANVGYKIYIDSGYKFKLLKADINPLMLSANNLNAYQLQENFDSKTVSYGGYYQDEETEEWVYIDSDKTGVCKQDTILTATSETEAQEELKNMKTTYSLTCKTKNLKYGVDYKLGDILRIQKGSETVRQQVVKINQWFEGTTYNEEPIFDDEVIINE